MVARQTKVARMDKFGFRRLDKNARNSFDIVVWLLEKNLNVQEKGMSGTLQQIHQGMEVEVEQGDERLSFCILYICVSFILTKYLNYLHELLLKVNKQKHLNLDLKKLTNKWSVSHNSHEVSDKSKTKLEHLLGSVN